MPHVHVAVAGAGLAGLAAAHELARSGAEVTVLEARDRIGGRVWTRRDGLAAGQHAEMGGEFIDEDHERMRALAARFDLPLVRVLRAGFAHWIHPRGGRPHVSRAGGWDALGQLLAPLIDEYTAEGGRADAPRIREMATCSLREWLDRQQAGAALHAMADSIRGFFLADPEELSVLPLVAQLAESGSPAKTPVYRIVGGSGRLADALAAATAARLLLRHHVRAVAQAAGRVVVRATDARGLLQEVEADAAVIALPASTLRDVEFAPPLPEEQRRAIERLPYGRATKAVVQCAAPALSRRRAQAFATDGALGAFWDATDGQPDASHGLITFLAGGSASAALRARVEQGRLLQSLCWLDLDRAPVTARHVVTWEDDPLARGGYAFLGPAFDPAWTALLSRPASRLVFAGEHTSTDYQGYMEGAVESGLRAAGEIGKL